MIIDKINININAFHNSHIVDPVNNARRQHFEYVLNATNLIDGHILEFGVFKGKSLKMLSEHFPDQKVFGFDSFEGLPEDWIMTEKELNTNKIKHKKGHFDTSHLRYDFKDNVVLVKGFFNISLPQWLSQNNLEAIKILHIDSDLYSSAKTIFDNLNQYIVSGTVIIFDELYPWGNYRKYELWADGEWKALVEWVNKFDRKFKVISRNTHQQCAIQII
jgi:hypothetical protein